MTDDFSAIVLFDKLPVADAELLQAAVFQLEPEMPSFVRSGRAPNELFVRLPDAQAVVVYHQAPMPEEAAISSLGMADLPEDVRHQLMRHRAHVSISCAESSTAEPINKLILLLKIGMVLCQGSGLALCIPASGICLPAEMLSQLEGLNSQGPRAWGVDEAEAALGNYEKHTLWNSLRKEGQPADILVGFVPAEIDNQTWFFSAGHTLFNMPEIVYAEGNLDDFQAVREYFRFLFRHFYRRPGTMKKGDSLPMGDAMSFVLEALPPRFHEFEASTGTLMVKMVENPLQDKDWD